MPMNCIKKHKDILPLTVRWYSHFLHNLVEEGVEGLEHTVCIPILNHVGAGTEPYEQQNFYEQCLQVISREKLFYTRTGKKCLNDDRVCIVVGETEEEKELVKELLASVDLFLPAVDQTDWESVFSGYPVPEEKKISLAYLLEHAQEILDYLIEQNPGPDHTDWVFQLYQAAMKNEKLSDQIMAGKVAVFVNQVYPPVLKRITEVKTDPGIPECLKDVSEILDQLDLDQESREKLNFNQEKLSLRSVLISPLFPIVEGKQPESYDMLRLIHAIGEPQFYFDGYRYAKYDEEARELKKKIVQTHNQIWGILLACGPDEEIRNLAAEAMDLEIPIDVKPIQDERIPESMWEKTYAAVLHVMMDDIMRCECLEKLSSVLAIGKQQTCDWLRGVWCLGKKYLPYDELKEQGILLNHEGQFVRPENSIKGFLDEELLKIRDDLCAEYREDMITPRWLGEPTDYLEIRDWPIEEWANCDLAKEINYFLANLFVSGALSAQKKEVQDACRRLYFWIGRYGHGVWDLFPEFYNEADRIKLLTMQEITKASEEADQLHELLEKFNADSVDELLELLAGGKKYKGEQELEDKSGIDYDFERDVDFEGDDRIKKLSEEEKESVIREIRNVGETYVFDWLIGQFQKKGYKEYDRKDDSCFMVTENGRYLIEIERMSSRSLGFDVRACYSHREDNTEIDDERIEYKIKISTSGSRYKNVVRLFDAEMRHSGEHYHLLKLICNPETMEIESIHDYADPLRSLGNSKNNKTGYLREEK